jgi:hypothetical protein
MIRPNLQLFPFVASAFALMCLSSGGLALAERIEDRGTKVNKTDKFEVMLDDKATGRMAFFTAFHATTKAKGGGGGLFDGVNNKGQLTCVLVQGRGQCSGFDINEKDGDTYRVEWAGTCYILTGSDGKPVGYCAGGGYAVPGSGTGRYTGLSGGGAWWGHALPDGDFEVEWVDVWEK